MKTNKKISGKPVIPVKRINYSGLTEAKKRFLEVVKRVEMEYFEGIINLV